MWRAYNDYKGPKFLPETVSSPLQVEKNSVVDADVDEEPLFLVERNVDVSLINLSSQHIASHPFID